MPDKDVFYRKVGRGWRSVARSLHAGVDADNVARRVAKALRKNLRELGGLPQWEELYSFLDNTVNDTLEIAPIVFDRIRKFERDSNDRDLAGIMAKAYLQTYIQITDGQKYSKNENNANHALISKSDFVKTILKNFLDYRLHSKVEMIECSRQEDGYWSDADYRQTYLVKLDPDLDIIAEALVKDPSFRKGVSLPRLEQERQATEELLYNPVEIM